MADREDGGRQENGVVRWRQLDREGCAWGFRVCDRVERNEAAIQELVVEVKALKAMMTKVFWALVTASVGFGGAALMLGIQLGLP